MSVTTIVLVTATFAFALLGLFFLAVHIGFRAPRIAEKGNPGDFGLKYRQVNIPAASGVNLFAWQINASATTGVPAIIILHGWGANSEIMLPLAQPFHSAGMNVLLVDARNHGRSGHDGYSSMPKFAEDVGHAADWLRAQPETHNSKIALLGHSVGAAAVLLAASRRSDVDAVISISSFAHPEWLMRRQLQRAYLPNSLITLVLRYVEKVIGHRFDDIAPMNTLCEVKCPVLLVHGTEDKTIPVSDFRAIESNCEGRKYKVLLIPGAGHGSIDKVEDHSDDLIRFLKYAGF